VNVQGNGAQWRYGVHMSQKIRRQIVDAHKDAISSGRGQRFVAAFKAVIERLRNDPLVFGEELYFLPALKLHIRQAAIAPLVVDFAVHDKEPLVFIRGFSVLL
jgi:hypothetical protein